MEKYAAEMKVVKITFGIEENTGVYDAISTGLKRNKVLKQVTIKDVPNREMGLVRSSKLSSIKTLKFYYC